MKIFHCWYNYAITGDSGCCLSDTDKSPKHSMVLRCVSWQLPNLSIFRQTRSIFSQQSADTQPKKQADKIILQLCPWVVKYVTIITNQFSPHLCFPCSFLNSISYCSNLRALETIFHSVIVAMTIRHIICTL